MSSLSTYRAMVAASDAGLTRVPRYDAWALRDVERRVKRLTRELLILCSIIVVAAFALTAAL